VDTALRFLGILDPEAKTQTLLLSREHYLERSEPKSEDMPVLTPPTASRTHTKKLNSSDEPLRGRGKQK
jgi:hypothetical protein